MPFTCGSSPQWPACPPTSTTFCTTPHKKSALQVSKAACVCMPATCVHTHTLPRITWGQPSTAEVAPALHALEGSGAAQTLTAGAVFAPVACACHHQAAATGCWMEVREVRAGPAGGCFCTRPLRSPSSELPGAVAVSETPHGPTQTCFMLPLPAALPTDVDCGGLCLLCGTGRACKSGDDCLSGVCNTGRCGEAPWCYDGLVNGRETGERLPLLMMVTCAVDRLW